MATPPATGTGDLWIFRRPSGRSTSPSRRAAARTKGVNTRQTNSPATNKLTSSRMEGSPMLLITVPEESPKSQVLLGDNTRNAFCRQQGKVIDQYRCP